MVRWNIMRKVIFYIRSGVCTVWFWLHGFQSTLVACDGFLPALNGKGTVRVGKRFVVRGRIARCEIATNTKDAEIRIGDRVFLNQGVVIAADQSIEIGDDTLIGDFSAIIDTNFHRIDPDHPVVPKPVIIGRNVWLGNGVLVLPGSEIGDHTVVAARSVVKGYLPPRVLAAGNPAEVVRKLDVPEGWRRGSG
jgi:acetyltransferase-like isoleucine patch superfamily enzyme